jgi:hypothetical protein
MSEQLSEISHLVILSHLVIATLPVYVIVPGSRDIMNVTLNGYQIHSLDSGFLDLSRLVEFSLLTSRRSPYSTTHQKWNFPNTSQRAVLVIHFYTSINRFIRCSIDNVSLSNFIEHACVKYACHAQCSPFRLPLSLHKFQL